MTTCPQGHQSTAEDYCDVCGAPIATAPPAPTPAVPAGVAGTVAPAAGPGGRTCPHCSAANVADALFCEACGYDFTTGTVPRPDPASIATPPRTDDPPTTEPMDAVDAPLATGPTDGEPAEGDTAGTEAEPAEEDRAALTGDQTAVTPGPPAPGAESPVPPPPAAPAADAPAEGAPGPAEESGWVAEIWIDPDWYALQNSADPMPSPGRPEVVALHGRSVLVGRVSRSRNIHPEISCEADSGVSRRQAQLTTDGSRWFVEDLGSANGTFVGPASGPLPEHPVPSGQRVEVGPDDRVYVGAWTRMVIRHATPGESG